MTDVQAQAPATGTSTDRRWAALGVLAIVQFLIIIDNTVVNVALPSVRRDLGFSADGLAWVVNGYLLTAGGLLLLGGRLADMRGRVRMFCVGTALFGVASLACGLAPTAETLVAGRFAQGVGEALASPAALSLIAAIFRDERERGKALGLWGGLAGLGAVTGVLLSGVLTDLASWRWNFLINVPFAVAALVLLPRLVRESRPAHRPARTDLLGAVLVTAAMVSVIYGALGASRHGWTDLLVLGPIGAGLALLGAFVAVETVSKEPLVPLRFFTNRTRVAANLASLFMMGNLAAVFLLLTLYMQNVLGYSALRTGVAYLPFCVAFVAAIGITMPIAARVGPKITLIGAFTFGAAGMAMLATADLAGPYRSGLLPALLVLACGFGAGFPALQATALHALPESDMGLGSGVQTSVQSLANALGVAVFLTLALRHGAGGGPPQATGDGYQYAFGIGVVTMLIGGAVIIALMPRLRTGSAA